MTTPPAGPSNPTNPAPPTDEGRCAFQASNVTFATTWVNTPSSCDYEVNGLVIVSAQLILEPGVVVRFGPDAELQFRDGGSLFAVGTPPQRITLEAASPIRGFAKGLYFASGSVASRIEYADLRYLGRLGEIIIDERLQNGAIAGFLGGELALRNSTVMGSSFIGAELDQRSLVLTEFADNRFYDNASTGIIVSPESVGKLDAASDYLGGAQPNGLPFVVVSRPDSTLAGTILWPNIGAPYGVEKLRITGGDHVVAPGAEFVFNAEGTFDLENGTLTAIGTPQQPILFRGLEATSGWWADIDLLGSTAQLRHVEVRHGGSDPSSDSNIIVNGSYLEIDNSIIADGAGVGIGCIFRGEVSVGDGMRFENLADGPYGVADSCDGFDAP